MSKLRVAGLVALFICLVPAFALAVGPSGTGGSNAYVERCEIPFPDWYEFHDHFDNHNYLTFHQAIAHCREFTKNLPYNWRTNDFTILFGPTSRVGEWRAFTCMGCVRYEHPPGSWGDHHDLFTTMAQPVDASITDAIALFGGRVSQVRFLSQIDGETGELGGGYEVTLVNADTGRAGVVQIDAFTGQATVVRDEPIGEGQ